MNYKRCNYKCYLIMPNSSQYNKDYFIKNKDKIMKKRQKNENYNKWVSSKNHICICGKEYKSSYIYVHRKNCQSFLSFKNQSEKPNELTSQA